MPHDERLQVIENWMLTISQDGGIERYDDSTSTLSIRYGSRS